MSLDISLEELRRRQRQHSSTPRSSRPRCPECESVDLIRKTPNPMGTPREDAAAYRCGNCQAHFDRPLKPEAEQ